jgi:hypothetical protein
MIKIKIFNPTKDRNEPTFRPFYFVKDMLEDYSIEITNSDDYDFLFIGMSDFLDKSMTLKDSIDWGLENIQKYTEDGDYFLFDGSDSTSLMGAYEVFENSSATYLFKNQLLSREEYKIPTSFNKWFFGSGSDLDLFYDIPEDMWNRLKLSGYNLGYLLPQYRDFQPISKNKNIDVCAIYQANHPYNEDHGARNDLYYTNHRKGAWDILDSKFDSRKDKLPYQEYINTLYNSKIAISPFGMGELCFRDFECMQFGTIVIKPSMEKINTIPNIYLDNDTYLSVKYDWSNLNEVVDYALSNFNELNDRINEAIRQKFITEYDYGKLCKYWYDLFSNLNSIKVDEE